MAKSRAYLKALRKKYGLGEFRKSGRKTASKRTGGRRRSRTRRQSPSASVTPGFFF